MFDAGARFAINRKLGSGSFGVVYDAIDHYRNRPVALKVLHPDLAHALGPERFQREIRLAARLQHPHILTVLDSTRDVVGGVNADFFLFTPPGVPVGAFIAGGRIITGPARFRAAAIACLR